MEMMSNQTGISFEEYLEVYAKAFGERMKEVVKKL